MRDQGTFEVPYGVSADALGVHYRIVIPAVREGDYFVTSGADELVVRGFRPLPHRFELNAQSRPALQYGTFECRIRLPRDSDPARLTTELHDGVLDVRVPAYAERGMTMPAIAAAARFATVGYGVWWAL